VNICVRRGTLPAGQVCRAAALPSRGRVTVGRLPGPPSSSSCRVTLNLPIPVALAHRGGDALSQLNGNPNLSKDQLARIRAGILYISKLLIVANHDTMLNLGFNYGIFFNTLKTSIVKKTP
jgi:hypothetical protein